MIYCIIRMGDNFVIYLVILGFKGFNIWCLKILLFGYFGFSGLRYFFLFVFLKYGLEIKWLIIYMYII